MRKTWVIIGMLCTAAVVHAGTPEAGDEVNAKIARIKSLKAAAGRDKKTAGERVGAETLLDDGCSIAIGNIFNSADGVSTSAKRETTVVVTGDVIQAGNKCE